MKINIYITQNFLFKFKKILFLLNNNVQLLSDLGLKELCSEIEIEKIHKDWKEYILKLENTIDKEYFKPYWLPMVKDDFFTFIDLSDENFPLFQTSYENVKPFKWHKTYLSENIFKTIEDYKNGVNIKESVRQLKHVKKDNEPFITFKNKINNGEIIVKTVELSEIICDEISECHFDKTEDNFDALFFSKVKGLLFGLIPFNTKILVKELDFSLWKMDFKPNEINTIKELVFVVRQNGIENLCKCEFSTSDISIVYTFNLFGFAMYYNNDYNIMKEFKNLFEKSKNDLF